MTIRFFRIENSFFFNMDGHTVILIHADKLNHISLETKFGVSTFLHFEGKKTLFREQIKILFRETSDGTTEKNEHSSLLYIVRLR